MQYATTGLMEFRRNLSASTFCHMISPSSRSFLEIVSNPRFLRNRCFPLKSGNRQNTSGFPRGLGKSSGSGGLAFPADGSSSYCIGSNGLLARQRSNFRSSYSFLTATVVRPNNRKNLSFPGGVSNCAGGPFVIQMATTGSDPVPPSSPSESEPTLLLLLLVQLIRALRRCSAKSSLLTRFELQSGSLRWLVILRLR